MDGTSNDYTMAWEPLALTFCNVDVNEKNFRTEARGVSHPEKLRLR